MTIIYNFMNSPNQQETTVQNLGIQNFMNSLSGNTFTSNRNQLFGNAFSNNNFNQYHYQHHHHPHQNPYQNQNPYQSQNPYMPIINNLSKLINNMMSLLTNNGFLSQSMGNALSGSLNNNSYNSSGCGSRRSISCCSSGASENSGCCEEGNSCGNTNSNYGTYSPSSTNFNSNVSIKPGQDIMNTSVLPTTSQTQALKSHFDSTYSQSEGLKNAGNSDVNGMYNEYISCDSLVKMYRATGDKSYIDKACQLSNAYIDAGKDLDGDGYKDWTTTAIKQGMNHDHYEWRAADGVAEVANQIMSDPNLKQQYAGEAQKLTGFIDKDVWQKWNNKVGRCGAINKVPSEEHFIARIGKIALNMYNCTHDPKYKNWLDQNVPKLKNAIEKYGDITGTINGGSIDNGHSADTADFISECYKSGLYFNKNDMTMLANDAVKRGLPPGWVKLAQFSPTLYQDYMNKLDSYKYRDGANVTANLAAMTAEGIE